MYPADTELHWLQSQGWGQRAYTGGGKQTTAPLFFFFFTKLWKQHNCRPFKIISWLKKYKINLVGQCSLPITTQRVFNQVNNGLFARVTFGTVKYFMLSSSKYDKNTISGETETREIRFENPPNVSDIPLVYWTRLYLSGKYNNPLWLATERYRIVFLLDKYQ